MDLAARTARAGIAHLPEVVVLVKTENMLRVNVRIFKGNAKCYPFYSLSDVHDYVKLNAFDDGAKDELGMPITDFDETTHYYTFFLTPKAVEWGNSAGQLYFCIFALGWGLDLVSDIDNAKAAFGINFKE